MRWEWNSDKDAACILKCNLMFRFFWCHEKNTGSEWWDCWMCECSQVHVYVCKCQFKTAARVCRRWIDYPFHHLLNIPPTLQPFTCELVCGRRTTQHRWWCHSKHLLHCIMDFAVGVLHLEFEDKHSRLICLLHVSVASGSGICRWTLMLKCCLFLFPSTAAKSLLNKNKDGVKVSCFCTVKTMLWYLH